MAKQTFTTGQVLTAAQMTSLQQTAMLGGAASAKTASYTLVAADAGTAISMSNASATTITVNTALFAAGDTVQITNLGAGVCTITAGTATVNTSASLALAQYESGTLDFTSTSAAIFIKGAGAAAASGGMTLINTGGTTLTGASVTISSIPATYKNLQLIIRSFLPASDNSGIVLRINADNTANRYASKQDGSTIDSAFDLAQIILTEGQVSPGTSTALAVANFFDYANTVTIKIVESMSIGNAFTSGNFDSKTFINYYKQTDAISSLVLLPESGNFTSGTAFLYGVS
jgi:hypothetical protein